MTTTFNHQERFTILHPEHLIDTLRAGGYFPVHTVFQLPTVELTDAQAEHFVREHFPSLSLDRHEIIVRFVSSDKNAEPQLTLIDIVDVSFQSAFRQRAAEQHVSLARVLNAYNIPVGRPMDEDPQWCRLISAYDHVIRDHTATTILRKWFGEDATIKRYFAEQVRLGFIHQQAAQASLLPPIPATQPWAHIVAYNAGLRDFEEREKVLPLQDVRKIISGMGEETKEALKVATSSTGSTFGREIDKADAASPLTKWLIGELANQESYLAATDRFLKKSSEQQSVLISAILYLTWRNVILDSSYDGKLKDEKKLHHFISPEQRDKDEQLGEYTQAIAEALYTLVYIGGASSFQKALQETRPSLVIESSSTIRANTRAVEQTPQQEPKKKEALAGEYIPSSEIKLETGIHELTQIGQFLEQTRKKLAKKNSGKFGVKPFKDAIGITNQELSNGIFSSDKLTIICNYLGVDATTVVQNAAAINIDAVKLLNNKRANKAPKVQMELSDQTPQAETLETVSPGELKEHVPDVTNEAREYTGPSFDESVS